MADADVRCPCGEFAKRQGIIHFAFAESRKLSQEDNLNVHAVRHLVLRPTELIIFGNPKVGTPLMNCRQSVAIDLPQKALIWEDETGQVWFSYNDPMYLAKRHGFKKPQSSCRVGDK